MEERNTPDNDVLSCICSSLTSNCMEEVEGTSDRIFTNCPNEIEEVEVVLRIFKILSS